ncbi:MAG: ArsR/SmtB family transcription factor [Candidatus Thorarchaeota archaeon]
METLRIVAGEEETAAVVRALNDENRRRILHALRSKRMSTSEICDFLDDADPNKDLKPQTVRYHLKELERAGLITQDGFEPAGNGDSHIMTKMWVATAENVFIATSDMDDLPERTVNGIDMTLDLVGTMRGLGFVFKNEIDIQEIAEDFVERDRLWKKAKTEVKEILHAVSAMDPGVYLALRRFLCLAKLSDSEFERYQKLSTSLTDRFRRAYREGLGKNPEVP